MAAPIKRNIFMAQQQIKEIEETIGTVSPIRCFFGKSANLFQEALLR
jgi:hypothetical protein